MLRTGYYDVYGRAICDGDIVRGVEIFGGAEVTGEVVLERDACYVIDRKRMSASYLIELRDVEILR